MSFNINNTIELFRTTTHVDFFYLLKELLKINTNKSTISKYDSFTREKIIILTNSDYYHYLSYLKDITNNTHKLKKKLYLSLDILEQYKNQYYRILDVYLRSASMKPDDSHSFV